MMFYATEIELKAKEEYQGIHAYHFAGQLLVFFDHARTTLESLGYSGPLYVEMKFQSLRGVPWIYADFGSMTTGPASLLDDEFSFSLDATLEGLKSRPDALMLDIVRNVVYATNWPDAADDYAVYELVRMGHYYNTGSKPEILQV